MIELRNVHFSYGAEPVLRDINLRFRPGEFCAIIGPNGCGKTTLLRLLSRLSEPAKGELQLDARPFKDYGRKEFARRVALMPQTRPVPEMTVREFVSHGRYPYLDFSQKLAETDHVAVENALQMADVVQFADRNLRELSGGERQRAYLALLLTQDTDCVLLDEPTTYLDIAAQFAVMQVLTGMRSAGKCVVAVLHDLGLAMEYCDRIIVMQDGLICADDAPNALVQSSVWRDVFRIACLQIEHDGRRSYIFQPAQ